MLIFEHLMRFYVSRILFFEKISLLHFVITLLFTPQFPLRPFSSFVSALAYL